MFFPFRILILLLLVAAVLALQVWLSRRKAWWPGLVLPALEIAYSVFAIISAIAGYYQAYGRAVPVTASLIGDAFLVFLQCNIFTVVLLAVYFICRHSEKRKKQLDKMNIQDL
ncbi:hypothetical protein [Agathobaculum sp. Marseille-P7918]|uniref:hypothetical protein n=1 Tax=Agathobaculum sp. Marseille-P7918 TaxID=2479843 RepID=UPI000F6418EC|nr:hypothetical protein [Agathobaculum sp. Marseille-P7918]